MKISKIKSYAKINLALNVTGKKKLFHKIESIVSFIDLHDVISINEFKKKNTKFLSMENFQKILVKEILLKNFLRNLMIKIY